MKTECDRGGQSWHVRDVMVPKSTAWMDEIAEKVVQVSPKLCVTFLF